LLFYFLPFETAAKRADFFMRETPPLYTVAGQLVARQDSTYFSYAERRFTIVAWAGVGKSTLVNRRDLRSNCIFAIAYFQANWYNCVA
jgi:hypothetical protein